MILSMNQKKRLKSKLAPKKKAFHCLQEIFPSMNVQQTKSGVSALIKKEEIPYVVKELVAAEVQIFGIREITKTLEDRFLEVTEGKEEYSHA